MGKKMYVLHWFMFKARTPWQYNIAAHVCFTLVLCLRQERPEDIT